MNKLIFFFICLFVRYIIYKREKKCFWQLESSLRTIFYFLHFYNLQIKALHLNINYLKEKKLHFGIGNCLCYLINFWPIKHTLSFLLSIYYDSQVQKTSTSDSSIFMCLLRCPPILVEVPLSVLSHLSSFWFFVLKTCLSCMLCNIFLCHSFSHNVRISFGTRDQITPESNIQKKMGIADNIIFFIWWKGWRQSVMLFFLGQFRLIALRLSGLVGEMIHLVRSFFLQNCIAIIML